MSRTNIRKKLQRLIRRRDKTFEELLQTAPILRGSLSRIHTRCGKPNCWCAQSTEGHSHTRITWSQHGTLITRKVPLEQIHRITQLTDNYRKFRALRRTLLVLDGEVRDLLRVYEMALTDQARQPLDFHPAAPKSAAHARRSWQKRSKPREDTL